jgi:predicted permease
MTPLRPRIRRLFRLDALRRRDAVRDVNDEIALHVALRTAQLVREGRDPSSAEREARAMFAQHDAAIAALYSSAGERNFRMRSRETLDALRHDLRYALRRLVHEPVVATFLVLTLAFGIGANVTAFSMVDRVLLRGPEHVVNPHTLTRIYMQTDRPPVGVQTSAWIPYGIYAALKRTMAGIDALGAYRVDDAMVGTGEDARTLRVGTANGEMFRLLGAQPLRGRFFSPGDDASVTGHQAVLSESYWRNELHADPAVVGRSVSIGDNLQTIVGVAPAGFTGPGLGRVDAWTLIDLREARNRNWNVVGRLSRGATVAIANREAEAAHRRTAAEGPIWTRNAKLLATPLGYDDHAREAMESVMARWLAAVSVIILLIACANVINLQLARLARRRQEMGIRIALGAGRSRIVRLLLLEGLLLGVASGLASLAVALVIEPVLRRTLFQDAGWTFSVADSHVLAAVGAITLGTALIISLAPALQFSAPSLTSALRSGMRVGGSRTRVRSGLTIAQAALSVVLLAAAGLFLRSLAKMHAVDLGLDPDRVVTADVRYARVGSTTAEQIAWLTSPEYPRFERQHFGRMLDAVRRLPGVAHAALTIGLPFEGSFTIKTWLPGQDSIPTLPNGGPYITAVGDDYFATVGTRLLQGRVFKAGEGEGSAPVVIVGATMARTLWPGRNAVGECLIISEPGAACSQVVGVVADIHRSGFKEEPSLQYYVPMGQERGFSGATLLVRPANGAKVTWATIRKTILAADPSARAIALQLLGSALDAERRPLRLGMVTFLLSGVLALVVAALGLYSLMSYAVAWRTHELGVRISLGATSAQIAGRVVASGTGLTAIGIVIGIGLSFALRRLIQPQLFDTSASDPVVLVGVSGALLLVSVVAGLVPARRAARISPMEALRES